MKNGEYVDDSTWSGSALSYGLLLKFQFLHEMSQVLTESRLGRVLSPFYCPRIDWKPVPS